VKRERIGGVQGKEKSVLNPRPWWNVEHPESTWSFIEKCFLDDIERADWFAKERRGGGDGAEGKRQFFGWNKIAADETEHGQVG